MPITEIDFSPIYVLNLWNNITLFKYLFSQFSLNSPICHNKSFNYYWALYKTELVTSGWNPYEKVGFGREKGFTKVYKSLRSCPRGWIIIYDI